MRPRSISFNHVRHDLLISPPKPSSMSEFGFCFTPVRLPSSDPCMTHQSHKRVRFKSWVLGSHVTNYSRKVENPTVLNGYRTVVTVAAFPERRPGRGSVLRWAQGHFAVRLGGRIAQTKRIIFCKRECQLTNILRHMSFCSDSSSDESNLEYVEAIDDNSETITPIADQVRLQPLSVDMKARAAALNQHLEKRHEHGVCTESTLFSKARHEAALLIQTHLRRLRATRLVDKVRRTIREKKKCNQIIVSNFPLQMPTYCSINDVNKWVENAVYVRKVLPFVHATNEVAWRQLERVLHFAPGFTLRRFVSIVSLIRICSFCPRDTYKHVICICTH